MNAASWIVLALALCLSLLFVTFRAVTWVFAEMSGWRKLEPDFACDAKAAVWDSNTRTVRVNSISFRRCVETGVTPDALYLRVVSMFRFKPLRIPWEHMTLFQADKVFGRPAMRFSVEGSIVVVESALYTQMYPHLVKSRNRLARSHAQG